MIENSLQRLREQAAHECRRHQATEREWASEREDLREQIRECNTEINRLRGVVNQCQVPQKPDQTELAWKRERQRMIQERDRMREEIGESTREVIRLRNQLAEVSSDRDELTEEICESGDEIHRLRAEVGTLQARCKAAEARADELANRLDEVQSPCKKDEEPETETTEPDYESDYDPTYKVDAHLLCQRIHAAAIVVGGDVPESWTDEHGDAKACHQAACRFLTKQFEKES